jgi:uncharacterized membrane protein YfcA
MDLPLGVAAWCMVALLAGGLLKGVVGLGLPLAAMPLLMVAVPLKTAVGVLVMSMVTSNFAQSFEGGLFMPTLRRFWPLLVTLFLFVTGSTRALVVFSQEALAAIIGTALIVCALAAHFLPHLKLSPAQERWMAPLGGAIAGFIGGISGFYGGPLMLYLVWLRLPKAEFVPAISLMFFVGAVGLALGLFAFGISDPHELVLSTIGCIPVFAGLWFGNKVRVRLSELAFARVVLAVYIVAGISFLAKAI